LPSSQPCLVPPEFLLQPYPDQQSPRETRVSLLVSAKEKGYLRAYRNFKEVYPMLQKRRRFEVYRVWVDLSRKMRSQGFEW